MWDRGIEKKVVGISDGAFEDCSIGGWRLQTRAEVVFLPTRFESVGEGSFEACSRSPRDLIMKKTEEVLSISLFTVGPEKG